MKEGEWHEFTVGNTLEIPGSEPQLVLIAANGVRYLIPARPYANYAFEPGASIRCKIDKINCSGRIFLEPEHPYYKENSTYNFRFLKKETRRNLLDEKEYGWLLLDIYNSEVFLKIQPEYFSDNPDDKVECRVVRIKKGKLILSHPYAVLPPANLVPGTWLDFSVEDKMIEQERETFYVLRDEKAGRFLLNKKYFSGYGITPGTTIRCKVVKWNSEGRWVIEPEHPVYREGVTFQFIVDAIDGELSEDEDLIFYVKDYSDNKIQVKAPGALRDKLVIHQEVELSVKEIRKGKPVLLWPSF